MLYAGILLLVAVLLFGSSAVLGVIGAVLGFVAAATGLAVAAYHTGPVLEQMGYASTDAPAIIVIVLLGLLVIGRLALSYFDRKH